MLSRHFAKRSRTGRSPVLKRVYGMDFPLILTAREPQNTTIPCHSVRLITGFWYVTVPGRKFHHRKVRDRAALVVPGLPPSAWGTGANTESKLLLIEYAFESLRLLRIEFQTDSRNGRSRAALAKMGAVEEGTLRSYLTAPDGRRRDSVMFSILSREWPAAKTEPATEARGANGRRAPLRPIAGGPGVLSSRLCSVPSSCSLWRRLPPRSRSGRSNRNSPTAKAITPSPASGSIRAIRSMCACTTPRSASRRAMP